MKILLLITVAGLVSRDARVNGETNFDLPFGLEEPSFDVVDHGDSLNKRNIGDESLSEEESAESPEDSIDRRRKREADYNDLDTFGSSSEDRKQQQRHRHLSSVLSSSSVSSEENNRRKHYTHHKAGVQLSSSSVESRENHHKKNRHHRKSESSTEESREEHFRRQRERKSSRHQERRRSSEELNFGVQIEPETDSPFEEDEYESDTEEPLPADDASRYWSGESYEEDNKLPKDDTNEDSWERRLRQNEEFTSSPDDNERSQDDYETRPSSEESQRLEEDAEQVIRSSEESQRLEDKSSSYSDEKDDYPKDEEPKPHSSEEPSDEQESTSNPWDIDHEASKEISAENKDYYEHDSATKEESEETKKSSASSESHEESVEQKTIVYSSEEVNQDNPLIQSEQDDDDGSSSSSYEASSPVPAGRYIRYKNGQYVSSSSSSEESREKHKSDLIKGENKSHEKILRETLTYEKTYTGTDNPLPWVYQLQVKATQEFKQSDLTK